MKLSRFTILLGLSGVMISYLSHAEEPLKFCGDTTIKNMKSFTTGSVACDNAQNTLGDDIGLDDVDAYKGKTACRNTGNAVKKFYENFEKKNAEICGNSLPAVSNDEILKCSSSGQADCYRALANAYQPYINGLSGMATEFESNQNLLKKLIKNNGDAAGNIMVELGSSIKTSNKFDEFKNAIANLKASKSTGTITMPTSASASEKKVIEEINAGQKAVKLSSGISSASDLLKHDIAALKNKQDTLIASAEKLAPANTNTSGDGNNNGNGNTDGGGFLSGINPAGLMQMAASGLGIYSALNPQTPSGITPNSTPTPPGMNPSEKVTLTNKSGGTGTSAPGPNDPGKSSLPETSGGTGVSATAPYTPTSDISKTSDGNENKVGITTPSTGGGSEKSGGGSTPNAEAKGASEPSKPTLEEEAMASMGGGLKYQGPSSSSAATPELSAFDTSVKDILKDLDNNSGTENAFDGAYTGENAENASAAPFSGKDGIDGPDGASLFARMRSFHDRCLKRGCVINGLGEKI